MTHHTPAKASEPRKHTLSSGLELQYLGPPVDTGPLPAVFYLFTTAHDSLCTPPYSEPAHILAQAPLRVFSATVPHHGAGLDSLKAMGAWAKDLRNGKNPAEPFISQLSEGLDELIDAGVIDPDKLGVGGLSRGAFLATHVATRSAHVSAIVGFAPLTDLFYVEEFTPLADNPIAQALKLDSGIPNLIGKSLRYYIGNRDVRVGTDRCFALIQQLTEASYAERLRSPPVELIIVPSVGFKGHGTNPETFAAGAHWMLEQLGIKEDNA